MNRKRIACAVICAALVLCANGCGKTDGSVPLPQDAGAQTEPALSTAAPIETTEAEETAAETDVPAPSEEATDVSATETTSERAEISLRAGLNSTDVAEVMTFYKLAAAQNDEKKYERKLDLVSLNGGEGKVGSYVSVFEPIAKKAVSKNTTSGEPLPGDYKALQPSDWKSASADSDGAYTTIRVQVVPQTDGANGRLLIGTVGRSMSVLDGIQTAIDEMPGVSADFEHGEISLEYQNPTITVKVDNRTGKFVPGACTWKYRVHTSIPSLDAKVLAFNVHLTNAGGDVDYTVTY